jgi:hypothetical protein
MTAPAIQNQNETAQTQPQPNDKEINFRKQEMMFQRQLEQERQARLQAEQEVQRLSQSKAALHDDDEDDSEPYVDRKKLNKSLAKQSEQFKQHTTSEINQAVHTAIKEERQNNWLKQNSDFHEIMQYAEKFAQLDPELAETILEMPPGFERQKLVYKNIKALGIHKPQAPASTIQDKVDANRRGPYYQPTGIGSAPYSTQGDFTSQGQKQAYEKMQQMKQKLSL